MSYYAPGQPAFLSGLGQISDEQVSGAIALATSARSIANDPSALATLSPFSQINMASLTTVLNSALGGAVEKATDEVISLLPDSVMATVGDVVSEIGQMIPVVGLVFKFIGTLISSLSGGSALRKQLEDQQCQLYLGYYGMTEKVATGGSLDPCHYCPADLFYPSIPDTVNKSGCDPNRIAGMQAYKYDCPYDPIMPGNLDEADDSTRQNGRWGPNGEQMYAFRPALGQALMRITEGGYFEPYEIQISHRSDYESYVDTEVQKLKEGFSVNLAKQYRLAEVGWFAQWGGVPYDRRMQFRELRRAMQLASSRYGTLSDAGLSLWPVYMDLLVNAFDTGQLNAEYVNYMLRYQYLTINGHDYQLINRFWFGMGYDLGGDDSAACADALTQQIMDLVSSWKKSVQTPGTQMGAAKLAGYVAQATSIARRIAGLPPRFRYYGPSQLKRVNLAPPPVKKLHTGSALLGAGAAAAIIYLFL